MDTRAGFPGRGLERQRWAKWVFVGALTVWAMYFHRGALELPLSLVDDVFVDTEARRFFERWHQEGLGAALSRSRFLAGHYGNTLFAVLSVLHVRVV